MRFSKLLMGGTVSFFTVFGLLTVKASADQAQEVRWARIIGIQQAFDLVGVGTGQVTGGAPWETTVGAARVNLTTGRLRFAVQGLVLAVGSAGGGAFTGLDIGTPAGVSQVKGTLVCDVDGSAGGGNSVLVDTPAVLLSAKGDARFNGNVGPLPVVCSSEPDIAFLIRIVLPAAFADRWIAAGAVRIP
ncbi:MAG TPA: hypothetical protein VGX03_21555 [Candidatus Binatia bacterium]|jgi:hypothetical protein|nr:hypothetical protein [Candidatus Binatia bacterium]